MLPSALQHACQKSAPCPAEPLCKGGSCCPSIGTCCCFRYPKVTQTSHLASRYDTGHMADSCPSGVAAGCPEASQMAVALLPKERSHIHRSTDSLSLASLIRSHLKHISSSQQCLQWVIAESNEQFI